MARGNRTGYKRNTRNKVELKERGSDESDEDYNVSEDEVFDESEDEYCSSLADEESGESLGEFEDEEEEWIEKKAKKAGKPQLRKGPLGRKKNGVTRPRKKSVAYNEEEEEEEEEDDDDDFDDVEFTTAKQSKKNKLLLEEEEDDDYEDAGYIPVKQSKKNKLSHKEEEDDDFEDFCFEEKTDMLNMKSRLSRPHSCGNGSEKKNINNGVSEAVEDSDFDEFEKKPRTKARVAFREADEESDFDEFEKKPRTKARVSFREADEESDFDEFGKKPRTKARVSYREAEEDSDFDEFEKKPRTKPRVSYREAEEDSDFDEFGKKPRTKPRVSYREAEEDSDFDEFGKKPRTKPRVSYREAEEESDFDEFGKEPRTKARVSYREAEEDSDFDDFRKKPRTNDFDEFQKKPRTKARVSYTEALEDSDFDDSQNKPRTLIREAEENTGSDDSEKKPRTKSGVSYNEAGEECDYDDSENKPSTETRVSFREAEECSDDDDSEKKPRTEVGVSYHEAGEESDHDDSNDDDDDDDDDDVEFTPDEIDGLDDEEDLPVSKSRLGRPRLQEARITKASRRKRNPKVLRGTKRKGPVKEQVARKKRRSDPDDEFVDNEPPTWKKTKITKRVRRKSSVVNSDSDFVSSGRSDCEFTISEEEREQVKEASEFCKRLSCSLRSSGPLNLIEQEETAPPERKRPGRKGKEKVAELKIEVGKPVCGICLSEEGKRTVRGILNCCNHYFCFACIMEWSKVESRCPLCKQRFTAISRTSRADGGHDLRDAVIAVPERDQVYQPSEEELRGYLDPYENVLCTECQQGGDDAHMLLCDLCDSPAHTYCVGLGQEVPEGNWYCDGCRPTVLASQAQTPTTDRASSNPFVGSSSPVPSSVRETFDLNEMYVPETPLSQGPEPSPLSRHPTGDPQVFSPTYGSGAFTYGSGAFTLFDRRRIQRQIHNMLNNRIRQPGRSDAVASVSSTTLFGSQIVQGVSVAPHNTVMPMGSAPHSIFQQGRLPDPGTTFMYAREGISPGFSNLRGQALRDQTSASMGHNFIGFPHSEFGGVDARIGEGVGHHQFQPCSSSRSNTGGGTSMPPFQFREATVPSRTWQGSLHPPF